MHPQPFPPRVDTFCPRVVRRRRMRSAVLLLWVAVAVAASGRARAQSAPDPTPVTPEAAPPAANLSPAQAAQVLDVLQDPAKRDQFIGRLQAIAKALPAQP